ncbi:hypothetical protein CC78DRAFT_520841 [Lojkania enalia]|uniref:Macro domain-containing protein n=1 Tax=Lojkania enalia TaxID=147567 RepID=A0A9P4K6D9_9PLEO|nr:hypothetical protein CC78DRAFT_520841 [Didymosphaeria enalia]
MATIRLGTAANVHLFQSLTTLLRTTDSPLSQLIDGVALEDEFGRYRVWSGNLGALQKGHSSLDYRLRDSPLLSSNTLKLLKELEQNLSEAIAVISGSRLPYEQQPKPDEIEEKDDDFYSEDEDDDDDRAAPKTELEQRFLEIVDIVDNLYKLSVRIRTPTLKSRSLKAASYRPKDPETGIDIFEEYARFDLQHTRELIQHLRAEHVQEVDVDNDFLVGRISRAITLRRRQFKYWRRHRDKLGVSTILDDTHLTVQPIAQQPDALIRHDTLEVQPERVVPIATKEAPSEKTGKTLLSGTEATQHHQSLDEIVDSKSVTSYATTVHDLTGRGVELPSPPNAAAGDKDFECPYCFIICPSRYGKGRSWRTHLLQDLQPYVCTYSDCDSSEQLFRSRREWIEHEASHRKAWRCPEHPNTIYSTQSGFKGHLRQNHSNSISEQQFDSIMKVAETSTVDLRPRCPICFAEANMEGGLQNHLANHLERLAAFSLPKDVDDADDESSVGSSAASQGSSQDLSEITFHSKSMSGKENDEQILESTESPVVFPSSSQEPLPKQDVLSVEALNNVPDATLKRLAMLGSYPRPESLTSDNSDIDRIEVEVEENTDEIQSFRRYLLGFLGAQSARFSRRAGFWEGYATFETDGSALAAVASFDKNRFPDIKVKRGLPNKASLKFTFPVREKITPKAEQAGEQEGSVSSMSLSYNESADDGRLPVLTIDDIPTIRSLYRVRKLQQRDQSYAPNDAYNQIISFCFHDITRLKVDAIVNSANRAMENVRPNDSLNRYIHKAAGPLLKKECKTLDKAKFGQVRVTKGYNLPSSYIIHAARPQYGGPSKATGNFNLLTECYRGALKAAISHDIKTLAFPCLAAGGCGFPPRIAARIALQEVREFLDVYKTHNFEKIIFCVYNGTDERAYKDFLPVFFPPTHGDIENAEPVPPIRNPASLASQLQDTYTQLDVIARELLTFDENMDNFPKIVFGELVAISSTLRSLRDHFRRPRETIKSFTGQTLADADLICSVLQNACGSLTEIVERTKYTQNFGEPSYQTIWNDYNSHMRNIQGLDVHALLELCQDFVQGLDDVYAKDGVESYEMRTMRVRLSTFRVKQTGQSQKEVQELLDETLYTREFQRDAITLRRDDAIKVHQIPSISRLYQLGDLGSRRTNSIPDTRFNNIVSFIREDITRLEVDIIVNSTDPGFTSMGTLDRTVFRKGGLSMQEDVSNFGICKEGDIRITSGYLLPARHVIHTVPPETYRSNSKDVLRKLYREALFTATSLKASSLAFPAIGTGMLNYPKRDCASLAIEEVKRFLETVDETNPLEKIIFCVFGSNDEFIYKSLLPLFFPPMDSKVNKVLPSEWRQTSSPNEPKPYPLFHSPPPKKTVFSTIGDAFRSVRFGKQPEQEMPDSRPPNNGEVHALANFEVHAQSCPTCNDITKLYDEGQSLCPEGYGEGQGVLQYLYMEAGQVVYSTNLANNKRVKVKLPPEYPHCRSLLLVVEQSNKDTDRQRPFVSLSQPYALREEGRAPFETISQGQEGRNDPIPPGVTIYNAEVNVSTKQRQPEKAIASVFTWSKQANNWEALRPHECSIHIYPGILEIYKSDHKTDIYAPILSLELTPSVPIQKQVSTELAVKARNLKEPLTNPQNTVKFQSRSPAECEILFQQLKHARDAEVDRTRSSTHPPQDTIEGLAASQLQSPGFANTSTGTQRNPISALTQQLHVQDVNTKDQQSEYRLRDPSASQLPPMWTHPIIPMAAVYGWNKEARQWRSLHRNECSIMPRPSRLEIYENGTSLIKLFLSMNTTQAHESDEDGMIRFERATPTDITIKASKRSLQGSLITSASNILLRSRDSGECSILYNLIKWAQATPEQDSWDPPELLLRQLHHRRVGTQTREYSRVPDILTARGPLPIPIPIQDSDPQASGLAQLSASNQRFAAIESEPVLPSNSRPPHLAKLDLAISGLSSINIDDYFSYITSPPTSPDTSQAPGEPSVSLGNTSPPAANYEIASSPDQRSSHQEPVTFIQQPPRTRWTKIDRRLVNPQALFEANEQFQGGEDFVIAFRDLTREQIVRLAERTREIRRGEQTPKGLRETGEMEDGVWERGESSVKSFAQRESESARVDREKGGLSRVKRVDLGLEQIRKMGGSEDPVMSIGRAAEESMQQNQAMSGMSIETKSHLSAEDLKRSSTRKSADADITNDV